MSGLHMRAISHAFGSNRVLSGVSVFVAPGELVCLSGPSGCGKTTLLRLAAGLEHLQTGQVEIDGRIVADGTHAKQLPPEQRGVGLMFQDYALFPHLNVRDNVAFGLDPAKGGRRSAWIDDAISTMGLTANADVYPHTLSGGQQQRVALIRALAPGPQILLLDEPFSGLDVTRRAQIRAETLQLVKQAGVATLMVTHDPEEAMFMADRILVMNAGRVIQDGTPVDLYFKPADSFVAELFGPVNRFAGIVQNGRIETPLGTFDATATPDGSPVEVMIRPEGLRLALQGETPMPLPGDPGELVRGDSTAEVVTARPLGRSSFIVLKLANGERAEARIPGVFLPATGSKVEIAVNARQVHIFKTA
jgi:iron(III) transport system ATP-binding protein